MFKVGHIYENTLMPNVFIKVDVVKKRDRSYIYLVVSWYRKDEITKKLIDMNVQQDMVVMTEEERFYRKVV